MEQWKDITWYEWLYQVSESWEIKSIWVFRKNRSDWSWYIMPEKVMSPAINNKWYLKLSFAKESKKKTFFVHRLVAIAFIPNPLNLPEVNHKDWNKLNCHKDNLEWSTRSDNLKHAFRVLWRVKRDWSKSVSKILNWNIICTYSSAKKAEEETWIDSSTISKVCRWIKKSAGWFYWSFNL